MTALVRPLRPSGMATIFGRYWRAFESVLALWARRRIERAELARMTDRERWDFGISRSEAIEEVRKPFWRG